MMNKAFFLDRDGTIIADRHYLSDPKLIEFIPGAIEALKLAKRAGYLLIVVTNQSGIARGYFTFDEARRVNEEFCRKLSEQGAELDGLYMCPHYAGGSVAPYNTACDCRKPGLALFRQAIADFHLDPSLCAACGDKKSDTERLTELGLMPVNLGLIGAPGCVSLLEFVKKVLNA